VDCTPLKSTAFRHRPQSIPVFVVVSRWLSQLGGHWCCGVQVKPLGLFPLDENDGRCGHAAVALGAAAAQARALQLHGDGCSGSAVYGTARSIHCHPDHPYAARLLELSSATYNYCPIPVEMCTYHLTRWEGVVA
jgi:hypothetical protein